ncbi:MAG: DNA primase [Candidatus Omnitrophica bacterium]|nr:DNA primase [Candidatus Omnitrophota bacterium]MBU1630636.1 DNA primase [Candidatus Omnitrophota bacterium]MBU1889006.1 DNA primase [Candidatus Omnitrophota bacterium]
MISEEKINEILGLADIVRIIEEFYPLKSAGKNYKTLCPFHQEKTPSFIISSEKQIFHCFGCGKGGNVFHFIMEHEKLSFPEAVKWVGQKIGVIVEDTPVGKSSKLYPVLEQVNPLFAKFLHSTHGKIAYQYLMKRGLKEKTLKDFSLGYAPTTEIQLKELNKLELPSELLKKGGILIKKDDSKYPYFRRRIIFPIIDTQGRTIAFGGRSTDNSMPKYLNSPESEIFEKGKTLYGLNLTRKHILTEKKAIIVEGYMDLISLYEEGVKNVVASLGTSLTRWQIRILSRLADTIYLVYDSDTAGERASLRSLELFIEEGLNPLTVKLPSPEDPDSYIKKYGKEKFNDKLNQSQNVVQFYLSCLAKQYDCKTIEGKVNISKIILPIINKVQSSLRKNEYIKMLADALSTNESILMEEISKQKKQPKNTQQKEISFAHLTEEELILLLMIEKDEFRNVITEHDISDFKNDNLKKIALEVYTKARDKKQIKPSAILNLLSSNAKETLSKIMAKEEFYYKDWQQTLNIWRRGNITRKIVEGKLTLSQQQAQIEKLQKLMQPLK